MPGPIQSGISNILGTATMIAGGAKHLKEQQAQTVEQSKTAEISKESLDLQKKHEEEAEKKAETEYKANITAGIKQQEKEIYDEETAKAAKDVLSILDKHPKMSELERQQMDVYEQSAARVAGEKAMFRIEQLTKSDPFRKIALAYANGEIANRNEYMQKMQEEYLRRPTNKEMVEQGVNKYLAERSPDKRR